MIETIGVRLGYRMKALRQNAGLTQARRAELIGKSVETISNMERGKTLPGLVTLENMSKKLKVNMQDFFVDIEAKEGAHHSISDELKIIQNRIEFLSSEDIKIIAGVVKVLEMQKRKP